jgi:hypothetical protein
MSEIKAIKISADNKVEELTVDFTSLETVQKLVGGILQVIDFTPSLSAWMNEEGKLMQLPVNLSATKVWEFFFGFSDVLVGDVVFTGGADSEGNVMSIGDKEIGMLRGILAGGN